MAVASVIQHKVEQLPLHNDRNLDFRAPPTAVRLAVARVEPSFTSSDLFTPFSAPRSTLPSIAQFVRPSYGKENTWGQLTSSYGGVGPAADSFRKTDQGATSRSHKHYGSGCMTFHNTEQVEYGNAAQLLGVCDHPPPKLQRRSSRRDPTSTHNTTAELPSSTGTAPDKTDNKITAAPTTAHALEALYAELYGASSYKKDFTSRLTETCCITEPTSVNTSSHQALPRGLETGEGTVCCCKSDASVRQGPSSDGGVCPCDNEAAEGEEEEADTQGETDSTDSREGMLPNHLVVLPEHITISQLCGLPVHFRRITTKYTRHKCATLPCKVPYYLYYGRHLLPSSITAIPSNCFSQGGALGNNHLPLLPRETQQGEVRFMGHDLSTTTPTASCETSETVGGHGGLLPDVGNRVPHGHLRPLVRNKALHQLGLKFRSQAHARFCSKYPDQVPDLRRMTNESSRRHTFLGYHATTFRG